MDLLPALARFPRRLLASQAMLEHIKAGVPSGGIASCFAELVEGDFKRQDRGIALRLQTETQLVIAPQKLQQ